MSNRMRKNRARKTRVQLDSLTLVNPNAAGVDIGAREHFVAVPPERCDESVRSFSSLTPGLHALADWLVICCITTVAMESTGVYWVRL